MNPPVFPVVRGKEHLKHELHSKLNMARALRGQDTAEGGRAKEDIGKIEIRMIEKIEEFETEL